MKNMSQAQESAVGVSLSISQFRLRPEVRRATGSSLVGYCKPAGGTTVMEKGVYGILPRFRIVEVIQVIRARILVNRALPDRHPPKAWKQNATLRVSLIQKQDRANRQRRVCVQVLMRLKFRVCPQQPGQQNADADEFTGANVQCR